MHNHLDDMLMLMMMMMVMMMVMMVLMMMLLLLMMMQRIIKATVPTQTNLSAFYCGELLLLQSLER